MKKNKIPLIALVFSFLLGIFGGTVAFYSSSSQFTNEYQTGKYKIKTTEDFTLPNSNKWANNQELSLSLTTKNEGSIPVAVRVSYYVSSSLTDPLELTFSNMGRWIKEGNYYYYRYIVNPNEVTKSLVSSIKNISNQELTCNTVQSLFKTTCYATNNVSIQFRVETVDIEKYKEEWNTNVDIVEYTSPVTNKTIQNAGTISVGDRFAFGTEEFYVVSTNSDETALLAKNNLNVGSKTFSGCSAGVQCVAMSNDDSYGAMAFSNTDYWTGQVGVGLKYSGTVSACGDATPSSYWTCYNNAYIYDDNSNLYQYVENYKDIMINNRVTVNEARLLSVDEAQVLENANIYNWYTNTNYWLGNVAIDNNGLDDYGNSTTHIISINSVEKNSEYDRDNYSLSNKNGVRPVIVVPTDDLLE